MHASMHDKYKYDLENRHLTYLMQVDRALSLDRIVWSELNTVYHFYDRLYRKRRVYYFQKKEQEL